MAIFCGTAILAVACVLASIGGADINNDRFTRKYRSEIPEYQDSTGKMPVPQKIAIPWIANPHAERLPNLPGLAQCRLR